MKKSAPRFVDDTHVLVTKEIGRASCRERV